MLLSTNLSVSFVNYSFTKQCSSPTTQPHHTAHYTAKMA